MKLITEFDLIFRDEEKTWMVKDLFHYNLYGTGSYKARLQAIAEANAKIQEELDEKKVGVDYKVTIFELKRVHRRVKRPEVDVSGHAGVGRIASMWSACRRASLAALNAVEKTGRRASIATRRLSRATN